MPNSALQSQNANHTMCATTSALRSYFKDEIENKKQKDDPPNESTLEPKKGTLDDDEDEDKNLHPLPAILINHRPLHLGRQDGRRVKVLEARVSIEL
jgi:hypothetical protein